MTLAVFQKNPLKSNLCPKSRKNDQKPHNTLLLLWAYHVCLCLFLAGCSSTHISTHHAKVRSAPYVVRGVWYVPQKYYDYTGYGLASFYGEKDGFHGRLTATGERFDKNGLTAAHRTLPIPCLVKVTNMENGRVVRLKVNDRGPFVDTHKRIIDVSARAAKLLGFCHKGLARVQVKVLARESARFAKRERWVTKQAMPKTRTFKKR